MKIKPTIRQITSSDSDLFPHVLELLNRTQGRDLFAKNYLDLRTQEKDSYVVGAFFESQLIGIGIVQIITTFDYYIPFDSQISNELSKMKVAQFSSLAIEESFQGKGIGQRLSQERLKWVEGRHCDVIIGVSWVSGLEHTSNRVFEKMGFRAVKRVENFYLKSSLDKPFECPGCRVAPCTCAAIFYRRDYFGF